MLPTNNAILFRNLSGIGKKKKKFCLRWKKAQAPHKKLSLHIDICADRILNILLNLLY